MTSIHKINFFALGYIDLLHILYNKRGIQLTRSSRKWANKPVCLDVNFRNWTRRCELVLTIQEAYFNPAEAKKG